MGEIADMMLDGTLCEGCGSYIGMDLGFPGYCSPQCARDRGADWFEAEKPKAARSNIHRPKVACPHCQRRVKAIGLPQHIRDAHPEKPA